MNFTLNAYIKYCLGYLSLTRPLGFNKSSPLDLKLPEEYFTLANLLNGDTDGSLSEIVDLEVYYSTDPKDLKDKDEEIVAEYKKQKSFALALDEIYNKAKNDTFTKECILRFGRFEFEVLEEEIIDPEKIDGTEVTEETKEEDEPKFVLKQFYLFSLPVRVEKEINNDGVDKYSVVPVDFEIRLNLQPLYEVFRSYKKEELVYEFLNEYVKLENEGRFSIPLTSNQVFIEVWHFLKAKLKLTDANFNEESFSILDLRLTLAPRSNFFLVEDLTKLSREEEKSLEGTSLSGWFSEDGLNVSSEIADEKSLYFPFPYDKYQRATTSLLANKASIIQGPPGTGKSETISNVISHLAVNRNRILFVSQKPQALRVVKDKLKTLEVPLLFGYVPSVKMDQSLDEESDTISSQLASLDTYINSGVKKVSKGNLEHFTGSSENNLNKKDQIINLEREVFALTEEIKKYNHLDGLPELDEDLFISNFTEDVYKNYVNTIKQIADNEHTLARLGVVADNFKLDKELFVSYSFSELVQTVLEDVKKTGFDRTSTVGRYFNNFQRKLRLKSSFSKLPKEIYEEIDIVLYKRDISRHSTAKHLEHLVDFCIYWEKINENKKLQSKLQEIEYNLGLSSDDIQAIFSFCEENNLTISELVSELSNRISLENLKNEKIKFIKELKKEVHSGITVTRKEIVADYLANIIDENIKKNVSQVSIYRKLSELQKAFKKSKKAYKTFDKLKSDPKNFETILNLVPIWIMDLDDASRLIPLVANMFDYVIFDEASQCNIAYTIPSMYRAKRAVFVGDSEQMRDTTVMFKTNQAFDELARRYKVPESLQIKTTGTSVQSVLDIAKVRFGVPKTLQYHYRSPMELIGFSNKYFYEPKGKRLIALNNKYLTYQDTNRIMVIHDINHLGVGDTSDRTNRAEADKALALYKEMIADPKYNDKSFAILAFFNDQAELIRRVFEENKYKESEKLKIAIIEGIQGDEKDIIIYSFVIKDPSQKKQYVPLTGESGDIKADINAGRVNVAFSRARLQVHCLVSLPIEQIPTGIWIKNYLEYVRDNGEVSASDLSLKKFDSYFEEEFYYLAKKKLGKNYTIQNQVESCGFKIDFVITNTKTGKQLAVECDGPTHFKDHVDEAYGIYVDSDIQRQKVLESAGWTFFRIGYSEWIEDEENKEKILVTLHNLIS